MTGAKRAELPRVLRRALGFVQYARTRAEASAASIFLFDAPSRSLQGLLCAWDWTRTSFGSAPQDWPTVERVLAEGESRTITEDDARGHEAGWFEPSGIARTICVPLGPPEAPLGVLFFDFDTLGDTPAEAALADVGRRVGRALARDRSWERAPGAGMAAA